jgi:fructose-bisphosphate aldolase class I
MDQTQLHRIGSDQGFFAALDQSGGSTPKALAEYGIAEDRYTSEAQMFDLVHAMRTRVMTNSTFDGDRILAAILFQQTMERDMDGVPTGQYLWETKQVVPFLKIDKGLAQENDGVQLMKPIDGLADVLRSANDHGMFGTKMRSVIKDANPAGVAAAVDQQFEYAAQIAAAGLVPILEPEVSIDSPHKAEAETMLRDGLTRGVAAWPQDRPLMLKLTIPDEPGLYAELGADSRVLRVVALSGGYPRDEACARLAREPAMIASFSRALLEGLTDQQSEAEFTRTLDESIGKIYEASVHKTAAAPA